MEDKKDKGRQKILMKEIDNQEDRYASFSKHRAELFEKANELVTECDVDIGVITFSPTGMPFSFFHPTVDAVVSRFQNPDMELSESDHLVVDHSRNEVNQLKNRLKEFAIIEDPIIAQKETYDEVIEGSQKGWWESIEQLNASDVAKFEAWLGTLVSNLQNRLNQLENGASSS